MCFSPGKQASTQKGTGSNVGLQHQLKEVRQKYKSDWRGNPNTKRVFQLSDLEERLNKQNETSADWGGGSC